MGELTSELERPPLEEMPKEEPKVEPPQVDELEELAKMLEGYGVQNAEQLEGKMNASKEVGNMARLLGEERQRVANLEAQLSAVEKKPTQSDYEYDGDLDNTQAVNLEEVISNVYRKERKREQIEAAQQQERAMKAWNAILSHKDYSKVKDVWEEKLKDPSFVYQIQNGILDPIIEYRDIVDEHKDKLLMQTLETIETIRKGTTKPPPHVESGSAAPTNLVSEDKSAETKEQKRFKELRQKAEKGGLLSEAEEEDLIFAKLGGPLI